MWALDLANSELCLVFSFEELRAWEGATSTDALNLGPQRKVIRGKQRTDRSLLAWAGEVGICKDFTEVAAFKLGFQGFECEKWDESRPGREQQGQKQGNRRTLSFAQGMLPRAREPR